MENYRYNPTAHSDARPMRLVTYSCSSATWRVSRNARVIAVMSRACPQCLAKKRGAPPLIHSTGWSLRAASNTRNPVDFSERACRLVEDLRFVLLDESDLRFGQGIEPAYKLVHLSFLASDIGVEIR